MNDTPIKDSSTIVEALISFQSVCPNISHNATGQDGNRKFTYTTLAAILEAIRGPLADSGLAVVQLVGDSTLTTRIMHRNGEIIEATMPLPFAGREAREIGKLITYCRRYQLSAILNLATEIDDDAEGVRSDRMRETFSVTPPRNQVNHGDPPRSLNSSLKQQLEASIAAEKTNGQRGNGVTVLKQRMRDLSSALEDCSDLDMLAGTLRGFDNDMAECVEKLPGWHKAAVEAISKRRRELLDHEYTE